jgi:HK97 family phage major capsid protein
MMAEDLDLITDSQGRFMMSSDGGPSGPDPEQRRLWQVPVIPTKEVPEGEQLLFDLSAVELVVREQPQIAIGQPGDLFTRNQLQVRAEGRYGLAIERAFLIVRIVA